LGIGGQGGQIALSTYDVGSGFTDILHLATGSCGYTDKTRLRGLKTLNFLLVRAGGLGLYSRDF